MLAHIYYLFIYVLTDTKNSNFCVMKVKDFIDWVRPITLLNPETELKIVYRLDDFDISQLHITNDQVSICIINNIEDK